MQNSSLNCLRCLLGLLAMVLSVHFLSLISFSADGDHSSNKVTVVGTNGEKKAYGIDELKKFERIKLEVTDRKGKLAKFAGVSVGKLLQEVGTDHGESLRGEWLRAIVAVDAKDDYRAVFALTATLPTARLSWPTNATDNLWTTKRPRFKSSSRAKSDTHAGSEWSRRSKSLTAFGSKKQLWTKNENPRTLMVIHPFERIGLKAIPGWQFSFSLLIKNALLEAFALTNAERFSLERARLKYSLLDFRSVNR